MPISKACTDQSGQKLIHFGKSRYNFSCLLARELHHKERKVEAGETVSYGDASVEQLAYENRLVLPSNQWLWLACRYQIISVFPSIDDAIFLD